MLPLVKNSRLADRPCFGAIRHGEPLYYLLYVPAIIFFCFFYVSIIFNPNEAADNMRKYGGFIPGIRPGKNTAEYMNKILTRITVVGGLYLSVLCADPGDHDLGHQAAAPAADRQLDRPRGCPRLLLDGLGVTVLFRRHVPADRGGRGHGHDQPDRGAVDHAPLRRIYAARRARIRGRRSVVLGPMSLNGPHCAAVRLLRAPAKGTQAEAAGRARWACPHISTGDICRQNVKDGTELGKQVKRS